ncbi:molybdopterin-binding protein [Thermohalobacter berrensis]|uniref:Molybdopterin molybdenumtransferase n=1 Tax=Thermohalobacter berrensis TaxID=99594 RepID=A0A419T658_9FIRM|nr:molybdopterin-binding protein [Thermohalobacter berrensis]RKD32941.1 molybdopterin-binding protein [Thermohalobacter berrensis]
MKKVRVEDAVGAVLGHDLTKIVPGEFKGPAFKKGHIIKKEDIPILKGMGKNHIYVIDLKEHQIHEDEAALRIGNAVGGEGIYLKGPSEGKVSLRAKYKGLLKINLEALETINSIELIILATLHNNTLVKKDEQVAGTRIIPLVTEKSKIERVEDISKKLGTVIKIKRLKPKKIGIVVTGTEVYEGRITDKFGPILKNKVENYGGELVDIRYAPDDSSQIEKVIEEFLKEDVEIVFASGGMSVDADDVTPKAIKNVSDNIVTYGSPVLPGAMFMLAYRGKKAIIGIPACGMYYKTTVFDLVFPRILAGEILSRKDIISLAHGGLCLNCDICNYPICPFGK